MANILNHSDLVWQHHLDLAKDMDDLARLDPRGQVAFVVGDGNSMGAYFSGSTSVAEARKKSDRLRNALHRATATMVDHLVEAHQRQEDNRLVLPALPLIVAGDDLFIALPARHALAAANAYAEAFEQEMAGDDAPGPTVALGIVVTRPGYPYTLAHEHAEHLMGRAKRLAREHAGAVSALAFERVRGIVNPVRGDRLTWQPGLDAYCAGGYDPSPTATSAHLHVQDLIAARERLARLPRGRVEELRLLFDRPPTSSEDLNSRWFPDLRTLLARLGRDSKQDVDARALLEDLGDPARAAEGFWRALDADRWFHALPDAIEARSFAEPLPAVTITDPEPEARP